ncbi:MAG TPA: DUF222 domain-containing protein [Acidimicrobiia bacterium]|nr:DUF222 domain-containing protein [Acidimicrobiia bacterium]
MFDSSIDVSFIGFDPVEGPEHDDAASDFLYAGDDQHGSTIPTGLEEMEPGILLAAMLTKIDVHGLSGHDRVIVLRAHQRMASHHNAKLYEAMGAITDTYVAEAEVAESESPGQYAAVCEDAAAEIRVALRWTRRAADSELSFALDLRRRLPLVFERLGSGAIDVRRAKTFDHHTCDLPVATARAMVEGLIDEAPELTPGELAAKLRRLRVEVDPDEAKERHDRAFEDRRVVLEATPDGTANLHALGLRSDHAVELMNCLHRTALSLKGDGDDRTMDQLRADVLVDLPAIASSEGAAAAKSVINLHVDLETLAELGESSGDLAGFGPVIADIARQITERHGDAIWEYTIEDRRSGMALDTGTTRRRPSASQARMVRSRDRRCVFPGCRMPASESDIDHTIPWAQSGQTMTSDLAPLCRRDHCIRHRADWKYTGDPDGDYRWISPLGHVYTTTGRSP